MSEGVARFRVLVVEDEPLIGMVIESAVERLGYEVIGPVAELGEALGLASDETLGGAILDINIRGGHSFPVADVLLKRDLPILLLTGYGRQTLPERLHDEAYLTKPFTPEQLEQELRNLYTRATNSRD